MNTYVGETSELNIDALQLQMNCCWDILVELFKICLGKCIRIHELSPLRSQPCNCIFENKFFLRSRAIVFLQQFEQTEKDWTCDRDKPFTCRKFLQEQGLNWQQPGMCHTNHARLFWSGSNGVFPATSLPPKLLGIVSLNNCFCFQGKKLFTVWKILLLQKHLN